ncbi:MAG TPA: biopolymer transporter ExbD [Polyangiaceae bacterium]|jgi:biopolymer transport protein ExbD|nr:biopolymer transporter ExbD [Polyangiaceae bacterium]
MADPNDAPLSAAQRSKIRRLSQPKEPDVGEEAGELNVVPYLDIITNVMIFVLASVSVTFVTSIDTEPPAIGGGKVRSEMSSKALNLSAFITNQGISLKTSGGNIAPGCKGAGTGITIPKLPDDKHDFKSLTTCARDLKRSNPDFSEETQVTITANPNIEYHVVIGVMDSLRRDGEETLFPDVHFGVAR